MFESAFPQPAAGGGARCDSPMALGGVSLLAQRYDGFILDQWGVLHDGVTAYAGAIDCLRRLRQAGKKVVVLSNSGKPDADNVRLIERMGFDPGLFDRFIGAGEDARGAIAARTDSFHRALGSRCYAFTRDADHRIIEGIGIEIVASVEAADFLAVLGIDSPRRSLRDYEAQLQAGIARKLPLICANPDVVRVSPAGTVDAPGALARRYQALGGNVFYHGKPYPAIYRSCLAALSGCAVARVVAIGDSMEHDVLGASRAGLRSAFIAGGIHADELGMRWGELPAVERWRAFAAAAAAKPDYLLPAFIW